jgi:actin-related protein
MSSTSADNRAALVLDIGSKMTRAGLSSITDSTTMSNTGSHNGLMPSYILDSCMIRPAYVKKAHQTEGLPPSSLPLPSLQHEPFFGWNDEAMKSDVSYSLSWPVQHSLITNLDSWEHMCTHVFKQLAIDTTIHPVIEFQFIHNRMHI